MNAPASRLSSAQSAAFLSQVPVLAGLGEELLEQLAGQLGVVRVGAGDWLFREGELGESLFVLASGRLEVVDEGPPQVVIRRLRRGDVLGELALLHQEVRSASVRARRDSELLELGREQFERLIAEAPGFAVGLTRSIGAQLAATRAPATTTRTPRTIVLLALDQGAPVERAAELLSESLRVHGSVAVLGSDPARPPEAMVAALERAETDADKVVLIGSASAPGDEWTDFCLREADVVLALSMGEPARSWLDQPESLWDCELVVIGAPAGAELIEKLRPREVQVIPRPEDFDRCLASGARRMAGKAIGLVLSGGGARAFAHLGVAEELRRAGVVIDRVGGVSLGALVGAAVAMEEHDPEALNETFRFAFVENNPTGDYTLPLFSLTRGARTRKLLRGFVGERRFENLPSRFFCLSCDLVGREPVVHRTGPLYDAVLASLSIPGILPPVSTPEGRLLVDGGVLDNLPVTEMARTGEGPVVAIDVTGRMGQFRKPVRPGIARLGRPFRHYLTGGDEELPRLGETIVRTVTVGSIDTAEAARRHADLVIQPHLGNVGLLDWRQLDRVREAGREATRAALERAPTWLTGGAG